MSQPNPPIPVARPFRPQRVALVVTSTLFVAWVGVLVWIYIQVHSI